jgi:hypothetical protein
MRGLKAERYQTIPHNKSEVDEKEEEETNQNSNNIFVYKTEKIVEISPRYFL